jgi:hypothetical protein
MSMLVYTSEEETPQFDFSSVSPLVTFNNISYGDWKVHREAEVMVELPESVQQNGSFYGHIYLIAEAFEDGTRLGDFLANNSQHVVHRAKPLSRYYQPARVKKAKKLIGAKGAKPEVDDYEVDSTGPLPILSHWATNLTLTIVSDIGPATNNPILEPYMVIEDNRYYPIIYPNDFWLLKDSQFPMNTTTQTVPLKVTYDPISFMKFNLYASMTDNWEKEQANPNPNPLSGQAIDPDEIKKLLLSANPYWAAATAILSVLHML